MTREELRRLARLGAEARLADLQREAAAIHQVFPELREGRSAPRTASRPPAAGVRAAVEGAVTRRRPKLSREARERIAQAQRKRWDAWRAKQAGTPGESSAAAARTPAGGRAPKKK